MKRWLEGPYSLGKQVQQALIQGIQKAGSSMTPANYRKSKADFDYTYRPTDIVFENRVWRDQCISCRFHKTKSIVIRLYSRILDTNFR